MNDSTALLRLALKLDAVATAAVGLAMAVAGPLIADSLGAPVAVLVPTGVLLIAYAGLVWLIASRRRINVAATWAVIAVNLLWVVESALIAAVDWLTLTALGTAVVLAQAAAVLFLVGLQYVGLRRAQPAPRPA